MNESKSGRGIERLLWRFAGALAIGGGIVTLSSAVLVTLSVIGRWQFNATVPADYELVEISVAVSVFAYLSYAQLRNGHIMVDTFTSRLPRAVNAAIDALWSLVLAAFLGFFAWGLVSGGLEARDASETLVQLTWPIWPVYMVCAVLCGFACLMALATAFLRLGRPQ
jgi:TRAP-type C4-dicarboxylate transport system permease small subunit